MSEITVVPLEMRRANGNAHELEGLCVPYNRISRKTEHPAGERFAAGAFAKLTNPGKIRLRAAHDWDSDDRRPVGVATTLTDTADGLVGRFRFYDTPEGRGAWENVVEETYGGLSVGFYAVQDRVAADGVREVVEARLHHVALVDEPAYDDAKVIAVRQPRFTVEAARAELAELGVVDLDRIGDRPDLYQLNI